MNLHGYKIYEGNLLNEENIQIIEEKLKNSQADAIFFRSVALNDKKRFSFIDGYKINASNLSKKEFLKLNNTPGFPIKAAPFIVGFVKESMYSDCEALANVYLSNEINIIDISEEVLLVRNHKISDKFVKVLAKNDVLNKEKYLVENGDAKLKAQRKVKSILSRSKKKGRSILSKTYRKARGVMK